MLSINIYKYILRQYIDLEEYISKYTEGRAIGEYEYEHKCPFCHEDSCFYVETDDEDCLVNSRYECYECNIQGKDVIDFNSRIKNISKYESMMELFNDLKKRNNAENLSDYDFTLKIVKSSDFYYDDFVEYLDSYDRNEEHKNEDDYITYLLINTSYDDVNVEVLNNPEYIYGLWEEQQSNYEYNDYSFLDFIPPEIKNNREAWIKMSKEKEINVLEYVSDDLKSDSAFVLECINGKSHQDYFYHYIDDKLKKDKEFIIKMLQENNQLFTKIDEKFRDDKEVVLSIFEDKKSNNKLDTSEPIKIVIAVAEPLLPYVSERLRNDKDVIMAALNYSWWEFKFVPKEYKKDKEIIEKVIKKDVRGFQYVDDTINEDDEFIEELLKKYSIPLEYTNKRIQEKYGKDKGFMKKLILQNGGIQYLSDELKEDKEYILEVVKSKGGFPLDLEYISKKLKDDFDFMLEVIQKEMCYFRYTSKRLRNNKEFVLKVMSLPDFSYEDTECIGDKLLEDEEIQNITRKLSIEDMHYHW